jgi:hypothetical protein
MHGSSRWAVKCVCTGRCRALTPAQHAAAAWVFVREGTANGYSRGCCTRALFVPGRREAPAVPQCAHTFHSTCTDTRTVVTHTHGLPHCFFLTTRRVLGGYSRGTHGHALEQSAQGSGSTEYQQARGYCKRYRVPHGAGPQLLQGGAGSSQRALGTCFLAGAPDWY